MDLSDYLAAIRADGEAVVGAARAGGLDASIAHCPGWDIGELV